MTSHTSKFEAMPLMEKDEDWEDPDDLVLGPLNSVLENMKYNSRTVSRSELWKAILFASTLSFVAGVTVPYIFYSLIFNHCAPDKFYTKTIDGIPENLFSEIKEDGINLWQKKVDELNSSTLPLYIKEEWQKQGLDKVMLVSHNIVFSLPSKKKSSELLIITKNMQGDETLLDDSSLIKPLCCASAIATTGPVEGDLVYANFGRYEDYLKLSKLKIDVSGKIVIMKYGMVPIASKIVLAQRIGAKGIILFPSKPSESKGGKTTNTSCNTLLPEETIHLCPSSDQFLFQKMDLSTVPVYPITNEDAEKLLRNLAGPKEPSDWTSGMSLPHNVGPGFTESLRKIRMEVYAEDVNRTVYSTIGKLYGSMETDRSIVVGSLSRSKDGTGFSVLLEIAETFAKFLKKGIRPRRSVLFCAWGIGHYFGTLSINEWIKEHQEYLEAEAVAYIDVDSSLSEHYQLISTPMLVTVISEATHKVLEHEEHDMNILIAEQSNTSSCANDQLKSRFQLTNNGRHMPFYNTLGVPSAHLQYEYKPATSCLHITDCGCCYGEVFAKDFHDIMKLAQIWTKTIHSLSHSPILPLDVTGLAIYLGNSIRDLGEKYGNLLEKNSLSLSNLNDSIEEFVIASDHFQKSLKDLDSKNFYATRNINDKLMRVGRSFVHIYYPSKKHRRNILFAPSNVIACGMATFPEVTDLLLQLSIENNESGTQISKDLQEQIAEVSSHVKSATKILNNDV